MSIQAECPHCLSRFGFDPVYDPVDGSTQRSLAGKAGEKQTQAYRTRCPMCGRTVEVPDPGVGRRTEVPDSGSRRPDSAGG